MGFRGGNQCNATSAMATRVPVIGRFVMGQLSNDEGRRDLACCRRSPMRSMRSKIAEIDSGFMAAGVANDVPKPLAGMRRFQLKTIHEDVQFSATWTDRIPRREESAALFTCKRYRSIHDERKWLSSVVKADLSCGVNSIPRLPGLEVHGSTVKPRWTAAAR